MCFKAYSLIFCALLPLILALCYGETGNQLASAYLRQGFGAMYQECDNFYTATCSNYRSTFDQYLNRYRLMTSETQIMSDLIQNMSMLFNMLVDGQQLGLLPFEINMAMSYRNCVQTELNMSNQQSNLIKVHTLTGVKPLLGPGGQKRSFREPDYTAHFYLTNWTAEQICAYTEMVANEAAAAHIYLSRFLGWQRAEEIRRSAILVDSYVRQAIRSQILSYDWISWPVKQELIQFLNDTKVFLGFQDWVQNESLVFNCFRNMRPNDFCKEEILNVHVYYEHTLDTLFVPLGVLLYPLFHPDYPASFKFGILGQKLAENYFRVLLKSQTHDQLSNLWSKNVELSKIYNLLFCKYDGNCMENRDVYLKMERNYAAALGLKAAIHAHRLFVIETSGKSHLPDFAGLNEEQLLFIAYGRANCAYVSDQVWRDYENRGPLVEFYRDKTPPPLQVLGTAMFLSEYEGSFKCSDKRDRMSSGCNVL